MSMDLAELKAMTGGEAQVTLGGNTYTVRPPRVKALPDILAPIMLELTTLGKVFPNLDLGNLSKEAIPQLLTSSKLLLGSVLRVVSLITSIPLAELEEAGIDEAVVLVSVVIEQNSKIFSMLKKTIQRATGA